MHHLVLVASAVLTRVVLQQQSKRSRTSFRTPASRQHVMLRVMRMHVCAHIMQIKRRAKLKLLN